MCDECAKRNKGMMGKVFLGLLAFVAILAIMSAREAKRESTAYGELPEAQKQVMREAREQEVPMMLGGLERLQVVRGTEALEEVAHLHGKLLAGLTDATVAQYGTDAEQAEVWVGIAPSPQAAQTLAQEMSEAIGRGKSPFSGVTLDTEKGISLYRLFGLGQRHLYFARGKKVVWAAADSARMERFGEDVVKWHSVIDEKAL